MGLDNIVYLAERTALAVPSYRRARRSTPCPEQPAAESAWCTMARQRATRQLAWAQPPTPPALPAERPAAPATRPMPPAMLRSRADGGGRLCISGRLLDVCAELERLVAAEAQAVLARRA